MKQAIRIGFLPLYLALYDEEDPALKEPMLACYEEIARRLEALGMSVLRAPVCRVAEEFEAAVTRLLAEGAEVLLTLHLAYSPSLESIDAIIRSGLPVVALDTTPCYDLTGAMAVKDQIMENHGIHGVQDLCSLLARRRVPYKVVAGHWEQPQVLARAASACRAAAAAHALGGMRVGLVGEPFRGMGDFLRTPEELREELGVTVVPFAMEDYPGYAAQISREQVEEELCRDRALWDVQAVNADAYREATRCGLALREWAREQKLDALTVNFLDTGSGKLPKMPFLGLSKMMAEGFGYAGEGDCLTAALGGALGRIYADVGFSEMFCPCWKSGNLLLSHMGEINLNLAAPTPAVVDMPFAYTDAGDTVAPAARFRGGEGVMADLAFGADGYRLILSKAELLDIEDADSVYRGAVRGWLWPSMPLAEFLEAYSHAGGTHHWVWVYGAAMEEFKNFGSFCGFSVDIIG